MKKKNAAATQPDKTETVKSEVLPGSNQNPKMYRDHSHNDHAHGRVNKFPFGSSHGPCCF